MLNGALSEHEAERCAEARAGRNFTGVLFRGSEGSMQRREKALAEIT
jgi:hypothetical protein